MNTYKNKTDLKKIYDSLGSTRRVAREDKVSTERVRHDMRELRIPRNPKLHFYNNNSGKGRITELYILSLPFFKGHMVDMGIIDDKSKFDALWDGDKVNIKSCHSKRFMFRIKKKRHDVSWYICCCYDDSIDFLIPIEIFIVPSKVAPHSGITVSLTKVDGKYYKYKLSHKKGLNFSAAEVKKYNKQFRKKYSKNLKMSGGDKK